MHVEACLIATGAFVASATVTSLVRRTALRHGVLDVPNERSSHRQPTPRGGGLGIVVSVFLAITAFYWLGVIQFELFAAVGGGGAAVALIGYLDDRYRLSSGIRFVIHLTAAIWAMAWLGGIPPLHVNGHIIVFGSWGYILGGITIAWSLNLFNFMDGIDGIAASEAAFVTITAALIALIGGASEGVPLAAFVVAAACLGFLVWNWPPARIFMGDVGSGYLGYVIAVLAVADARENPVAPFVWLILGGVFFVDATVTLLRRLIRRERVHEAHRSHAYQWLARRWNSHKRVTVVVFVVNSIWLFPCALLASLYPAAAVWLVLAALTPIVVAAFVCGAGRPEVKVASRSPSTGGE